MKDDPIEPYRSAQNPSERNMNWQKEKMKRFMISTGCDPRAWFWAACHVTDVHNHTANAGLNYRTLDEVRNGMTSDISGLLNAAFWDEVYFALEEAPFPNEGGTEKRGRWLGRELDHRDGMCSYILNEETDEIIVRSMFQLVKNTEIQNKGADRLALCCRLKCL